MFVSRVGNRLQSGVRGVLVLGAAAILLAGSASAEGLPSAPDHSAVRFRVDEGLNINSFLRQGPVAAHLLLKSGADPRILVAFPAGNSGVALWFKHQAPATWRLDAPPTAVIQSDARGRPLYGVTFDATIDSKALAPKQALLSSIRVLRDYGADGKAPPSVVVAPTIEGRRMVWRRDRLDGHAGYVLSVEATHGSLEGGRFLAAPDGRIGLKVTALSGETPLTGIGGADLLTDKAATDPKTEATLAFLSYREKFLAGSWRFDTYFGRDTLMSLRLLMPVLQPAAIEGGLASVLARLSREGEVAHEEDIGEFAVLDHLRAGQGLSDAPTYTYAMIDSSYMLAPVAAAWLIDDPRGAARAAAFLASPTGRVDAPDETVGSALVRNLRFVLTQARPFADAPTRAHLLELKDGKMAGQWRDSDTGLGLGRYPFDVNAVLAPAALNAIAAMDRAGLLAPYLSPADRATFAEASRMGEVWAAKAPAYFEVTIPGAVARDKVAVFAKAQGVPDAAALASLGSGPIRFDALSLNADGSPVAIVNSDESFDLLFGHPGPVRLDEEVTAMMRPFPAGLMTGIGLLVANPAYVSNPRKLFPLFTRNAYHGLVVWSWQQALLAAGLKRQLSREDLPAEVRATLTAAQARLWTAIEATKAVSNSELWSWTFANGAYRVVPFGAAAADADESNAAQLWSTVFLALKPPRAITPTR
jgi:hypothetical protein